MKNKGAEDYKTGTTERGGRDWGRNKRCERKVRQKNEEGERAQGQSDRPSSHPFAVVRAQPSKFCAQRQALSSVWDAPTFACPDQGIRPALHPYRLDEG